MKIYELMTDRVISIDPEESVAVAARTLAHYNIGALPVCGENGKLCGMVTDRDLVTRCIAPGKSAGETQVRDVMTGQVVSVTPDADASAAAKLMAKQQVRRLPVVSDGMLCGMISLGDLAVCRNDEADAAKALEGISRNVSER